MSFLSALMGAASTAQSVGVFDPALTIGRLFEQFRLSQQAARPG